MPDFILVGLKIGAQHRHLPTQWMQFYPGLVVSVTDDTISISDAPGFIENFFGARISAISGLIGLNGSGKSSTLNYLKQLFIKEKTALRDSENDIIIYLAGGKLFVYLAQGKRNEYVVENQSSWPHELITYHEHPKLFDKLKNYTAAFYTNGLDLDQKEIETTNYYNISTGYLLGNLGKINQRLRNRKIKAQAAVKRYQYTEFIRQMNFLAEARDQPHLDIPFKAHSEVIVKVAEPGKRDYAKLQEKVSKIYESSGPHTRASDRKEELSKVISKAEAFFWDSKRKQVYTQRFYELLLAENLLFNFFQYFVEIYGGNYLGMSLLLKEIITAYFEQDSDHRFEYFGNDSLIDQLVGGIKMRIKSTADAQSNKEWARYIETFEEFKAVRKFLDELLEYADIVDGQLALSVHSYDMQALAERYYSFRNCEYLSFKWPKLSAGEESLLAFFSRLDIMLQNSEGRSILLLIDEGDLYFHPEWQRNYLYYVTNFLERRLSEDSVAQIILTTHSPFLASDIPREYQVYLGANAGPTDKQTFGGNLYTLFSDHFFLGGSTTSEFARRKIKEEILSVIDSPGMMTQPGLERLRQLIDKVGDPVVRDVLLLRLQRRIARK